MAEGLFRHHAQLRGIKGRFKVRSAGTHVSQPGARPDQRALRIAAANGVRLGNIKARRVVSDDALRYDLIIAMDRTNARDLLEWCPPDSSHKINLLLNYDSGQILEDVPDPYYGSYQRFAEVYQIIDKAVISLMGQISGCTD